MSSFFPGTFPSLERLILHRFCCALLQCPAQQVASHALDWCPATPVPEITTSPSTAAPTASPVHSMAPPPSSVQQPFSSVPVSFLPFGILLCASQGSIIFGISNVKKSVFHPFSEAFQLLNKQVQSQPVVFLFACVAQGCNKILDWKKSGSPIYARPLEVL